PIDRRPTKRQCRVGSTWPNRRSTWGPNTWSADPIPCVVHMRSPRAPAPSPRDTARSLARAQTAFADEAVCPRAARGSRYTRPRCPGLGSVAAADSLVVLLQYPQLFVGELREIDHAVARALRGP